MIPTIIDPCLYFQFEDEQLVGINGSEVDDLLRAGTNERRTYSDYTLERFETIGNQQAPFTFAGIYIIESDNMYHIDQDSYMRKSE